MHIVELYDHVAMSSVVYRYPSLLIAFGALVIVVGFSFLDSYTPSRGVIWNAINGEVDGTPYHWIFAFGATLLVPQRGMAPYHLSALCVSV